MMNVGSCLKMIQTSFSFTKNLTKSESCYINKELRERYVYVRDTNLFRFKQNSYGVFDCESKKAMSIPDGEYELRTNMADYRLDTDEFITMQWATEYPVIVKNGEFDDDFFSCRLHNILWMLVGIGVFMLNNLIMIMKVTLLS